MNYRFVNHIFYQYVLNFQVQTTSNIKLYFRHPNPIKEQSVRLPHTCAPERYAKHYLPHREVRIPAERFCVIGTEFPITSKSAPQRGTLSCAQLKWVKFAVRRLRQGNHSLLVY